MVCTRKYATARTSSPRSGVTHLKTVTRASTSCSLSAPACGCHSMNREEKDRPVCSGSLLLKTSLVDRSDEAPAEHVHVHWRVHVPP